MRKLRLRRKPYEHIKPGKLNWILMCYKMTHLRAQKRWMKTNCRKTCLHSFKLVVIMSNVLKVLQSFPRAISWYLISKGQAEETLSLLDHSWDPLLGSSQVRVGPESRHMVPKKFCRLEIDTVQGKCSYLHDFHVVVIKGHWGCLGCTTNIVKFRVLEALRLRPGSAKPPALGLTCSFSGLSRACYLTCLPWRVVLRARWDKQRESALQTWLFKILIFMWVGKKWYSFRLIRS